MKPTKIILTGLLFLALTIPILGIKYTIISKHIEEVKTIWSNNSGIAKVEYSGKLTTFQDSRETKITMNDGAILFMSRKRSIGSCKAGEVLRKKKFTLPSIIPIPVTYTVSCNDWSSEAY